MGNRFRSAAGGGQRPCELRDGGGKFGAKCNRRLQTGDRRLLIAQLEKCAAEVAVSLGESRLERDHAAVSRDGRRQRAASALGVGEIAKRRRETRLKRQRAPAALDGR